MMTGEALGRKFAVEVFTALCTEDDDTSGLLRSAQQFLEFTDGTPGAVAAAGRALATTAMDYCVYRDKAALLDAQRKFVLLAGLTDLSDRIDRLDD